jgi:hypothetical protein
MPFEVPKKSDLDRKLSELMHDARHNLEIERQVIVSDAILKGAANGSRVVVTQFGAADRQHKKAIERARSYLLDFERRTRLPASEIASWSRPHLENLNNSLLGVIKPSPAFGPEQTNAAYQAIFAQRVDSLLRDVETGFPDLSRPRHLVGNKSSDVAEPLDRTDSQEMRFAAAEWRSVPTNQDLKTYIAEISRLLSEILREMKQSNNDPDLQFLSELEKQQLKAVLETALAMLGAPLAEKRLLERAKELLHTAIVKAGEKAFEDTAVRAGRALLNHALTERAHDLLSQLLSRLF